MLAAGVSAGDPTAHLMGKISLWTQAGGGCVEAASARTRTLLPESPEWNPSHIGLEELP